MAPGGEDGEQGQAGGQRDRPEGRPQPHRVGGRADQQREADDRYRRPDRGPGDGAVGLLAGAAHHQGDAGREQVGDRQAGDPGSQTLAGWLEISQRMIAQSLQFEERLRRSETEAQKLRYELEKVRRLADIDHMTGLPNRRGFDSLLEEELRKANENIEPLSVAFCDIDNFKRVNDTWGHDTGDRVISSVARSLAKLTDDKCHAARHGGEEFVMLFRGISLDEAFLRLNEAREALSQRRFVKEASDEVIGAVTFSGGIADVFAYESPRFALRAADEALYRAKHAGRNRICLAER